MLYVLIIICLLGMVAAMFHKGSAWSYPAAGFCGICGALLCLVKIAATLLGGGADAGQELVQQYTDRNSILIEAKMQVIGEYIAKTHPGAQVILAAYDEADRPITIMEAGLRAGLGSGGTLVGTEPFTEKPGVKSFNDLTARCTGRCDVLIVDITVPEDLEALAVLRKGKPSSLQLVMSMGDISQFRPHLRRGLVTAIVRERPDTTVDPTAALPDGHRSVFDSRYVLINADNIREYAHFFPELPHRPGKPRGSQ